MNDLARCSARRGSLLLVVAVLIVMCVLIGTTAVYMTDADQNAALVQAKARRLRALAWSGLQAAMVKLGDQREDLMSGSTADVPTSIEVFDDAILGDRGVVEFLPVENSPFAGEEALRCVAEAGKLNINVMDELVLAKLPGMDEAAAKKIAAGRGGYTAAEDVLAAGVVFNDVGDGDRSGTDLPIPGGPSGSAGTLRFLTATSWDAQEALLGSRAGRGGGAGAGADERVCLCGPLDDAARTKLGGTLATEEVSLVEQFSKREAGERDSLSDLVNALRGAGIDTKRWGGILDAVTVSPDAFVIGKIDIVRAPAEVLACIPGVDAAAAERLVALRGTLDAATLGSIAWPVTQGAMTPEQFAQAIDVICVRSLQWRVRVEARIEPRGLDQVQRAGTDGGGGRRGNGGEANGTLRGDRCVWEAVIDVADTVPRIVWMQDVTFKDFAMRESAAVNATRVAGPGEATESNEPAPAFERPDESAPSDRTGLISPPNPGGGDGTMLNSKTANSASAPPTTAATLPSQAPRKDGRVGRWKVQG